MRGPKPNLETRRAALRLRFDGLSFKKIGMALGVTGQRAQQLTSPDKATVAKVVARASGKCETCGISVTGHGAHIHHLTARGMTEDTYNTEANLTLVCIPCHRVAHIDPDLNAYWKERARNRSPEEKATNAARRGILHGAAKLGIPVEEYQSRRDSGQKWCSIHQGWLPKNEFARSSRSRDGFSGKCNPCNRLRSQQLYASGYGKRYVDKNREKVYAYQREYRRRQRETEQSA